MEVMVGELYERMPGARLPDDLIGILADDEVERRGTHFSTVYATVACPADGSLWFTFGALPAASRGDWKPVGWPW